MNTFRGAAHELSADALDAEQIRDAAILYLEAYLWRSAGPRAAMEQAMAIAHEAGPQGRLHPVRHRLHQAAPAPR